MRTMKKAGDDHDGTKMCVRVDYTTISEPHLNILKYMKKSSRERTEPMEISL